MSRKVKDGEAEETRCPLKYGQSEYTRHRFKGGRQTVGRPKRRGNKGRVQAVRETCGRCGAVFEGELYLDALRDVFSLPARGRKKGGGR
jgi:uncharacterized C2H2 Zn-finger protein